MKARLLTLVPVLAATVATAALAAPTRAPQVKDATGDALAGRPGMDIASVLYTMAGTVTGGSYVPKKLVVTMKLVGPVETTPGVIYEVEAGTDACDDVTFTYSPGTPYGAFAGVDGWADWGGCSVQGGAGGVKQIAVSASGTTIRWEFSLAEIPAPLGTEFYDFRARVDPTNPVLPLPSRATLTDHGRIDAAAGSARWVMR